MPAYLAKRLAQSRADKARHVATLRATRAPLPVRVSDITSLDAQHNFNAAIAAELADSITEDCDWERAENEGWQPEPGFLLRRQAE